MFFDVFSALCDQKGVSRYKACTDIGLNRAAVAKWKAGAIPNGSTLQKLSEYFGVTTDYLMGSTIDSQIAVTEHKIRNMQTTLVHAEGEERAEIEQALEILEDSYADLQFVAQFQPSPAQISFEQELVDLYRRASDDDKAVVEMILRKYRFPSLA